MSGADNITAGQAGSIKIGELTVNRIGLGTNRLTDTEQAHRLLKRALELDINFIDTADVYQMHASETTIGKNFYPYPDHLLVATKGGMTPDGVNGSPDYLRQAVAGSLERLRRDSIDLYQLHRLDPKTPLEQSIGTLHQLKQEGKIKNIGLSEVTIKQLEQARAITKIVSVQNRYNVVDREYEALVDYCTENKIVFISWFPLGGARGEQAEQFASTLDKLAQKYKVTQQQLALAWLLKRSPMILPIPGTLSIDHLEDNVRAASIELSEEDYQQLYKN